VTEKHDIFLQVAKAPVLVITNSFLVEILDKMEGRRGTAKCNNQYLRKLTFPCLHGMAKPQGAHYQRLPSSQGFYLLRVGMEHKMGSKSSNWRGPVLIGF
jgi:hypothetical protein